MNVNFIRSDGIYAKIMKAPLDKKDDIYRYELMMPFEKKWACYSVPMKAATPNGYDVIMASGMLGHIAPTKVDTILKNYPLYCPKCKQQTLIEVQNLQVTVIKEPDAQTQSR